MAENETIDVTPESSTGTEEAVVETPVATGDELEVEYVAPELESLTPEQHAKWLETGELPSAPKKDAEESATSTPDKPASGTGKETSTESKPKKNVDSRIAEIEAENARLKAEKAELLQKKLAERRELRTEISKIVTNPASQTGAAAAPVTDPEPQPPDINQFESDYAGYTKALHQYQKALARWEYKQLENERVATVQRQDQVRMIEEHNELVQENWKASYAEAKERYPDFDTKVKSFALPEYPEFDEALRLSPYSAHLAYELASNPKEAERIVELRPQAMKREIRRLELTIAERLKTPQPKILTTAKPPGNVLSGTNRGPVDEAKAALDAGDFDRYMKVMNERDAARYK